MLSKLLSIELLLFILSKGLLKKLLELGYSEYIIEGALESGLDNLAISDS